MLRAGVEDLQQGPSGDEAAVNDFFRACHSILVEEALWTCDA